MEKLNQNLLLRGYFNISSKDIKIPGILKINDKDCSLCLWKIKKFKFENGEPIQGCLDNGKSVTLLDCIELTRTKFSSNNIYNLKLFPHTVILGNQYFEDNSEIKSVSFSFDDFENLFNKNPYPASNYDLQRKQTTFVVDQANIFEEKTELGAISAKYEAIYPESEFFSLGQKGRMEILFDAPVKFNEMCERLNTIARFLGTVIGRPQNLTDIKIDCNQIGGQLDVYKSDSPNFYNPKANNLIPLIKGYEKEFGTICKNWILKNPEKWKSRAIWTLSLNEKNCFSIDRLVRSANIFDGICYEQNNAQIISNKEVQNAENAIRDIRPKENPIRQRLLNELAYIKNGNLSLREKIAERYKLLPENVKQKLPDIDKVFRKTVEYRNNILHRADPSDYQDNLLPFLTQTLEFIFAASDLVESGWNMETWADKDEGNQSHNFRSFIQNYESQFALFQNYW